MRHQRYIETRRHSILEYVAQYVKINHNAPSTRQIASHFRISQARVRACLTQLESERRIELPGGKIKIIGAEYIPPREQSFHAQVNTAQLRT